MKLGETPQAGIWLIRIAVVCILCMVAHIATAATTVVSRCWKPDGPYVETALHGTQCPAQLTLGAVASVVSTSYDVTVSTSAATTTLYFYTIANTSSCAELAPTRKYHIAGTGAAAHSTITLAGTGNQTETVGDGVGANTALGANTSYCTFALQMTGYLASNRVTWEVLTAPSSSPGPDAGTGLGDVVYHVANDGNNSNTGLTYAQRWQTLAKVEASSIPVGADVCLMTGSVFTEQIIVSWSGRSDGTDDSIVGTCYRDPANSDTVTLWTHGSQAETKTKAVIGDETTAACIAAANCTGFASPQTVGSTTDAQVRLTLKFDVQFIGLNIRYTAGVGMQILGAGNNEGNIGSAARIRIAHNDFSWTGRHNLRLALGVADWVVEDNTFTEQGQCTIQARRTGADIGTCKSSGAQWGATVAMQRKAVRGLVENNTCFDTFGECFNMNNDARYIVMRGNRVGNSHSVSLYCDMGFGGVIESNIIWGSTNGGSGSYTGGPFGGNIDSIMEKNHGPSTDCLFRNNYMTGGLTQITVAMQPEVDTCFAPTAENPANHTASNGTTWYCPYDADGSYYGNTLVAAETRIVRLNRRVDSAVARSNIFWSNLSAANMCVHQNMSTDQADFAYNFWSTNPSQAYCDGTGDVYGDPLLTESNITTLRNKDHADQPQWADAELLAGSTALGGGDPVQETTQCLTHENYGTYIWEYMTHPFSLDRDIDGVVTEAGKEKWEKCLYYDALGRTRHATTPDMGALEKQ